MALVFLSTLGTNAYQSVTYLPLADEAPTAPTPYVQEARLAALLAQGRKPDRVVVCVTDGPTGSKQKNWLKRTTGRDLPLGTDGLKQRLTRLDSSLDLVPLTIPSGSTEAQLWQILQILDGVVHSGDELIVDITHGFRSQAIVVMTALDYLQRARQVTVSQVTYGAYEAKPFKSPAPRPTFDLTPFFVLRDWTAAIALLNAGDLRALGSALDTPRQALGHLLKRDTPKDLALLPGALESLGDDLWCCRLRQLPEHVDSTLQKLEGVRNDLTTLQQRAVTDPVLAPVVGSMQPLLVILEMLKKELSRLQPGKDDPDEVYGLLAAGFALEHGLVVQGFNFLRESLLDSVVRKLGQHVTGWKRREQDSLLGHLAHQANPKNGDSAEDRSEAATVLREHQACLSAPNGLDWLWKISKQTTDYRNMLSHGGTGDNIPKTSKIQDSGRELVEGALAFARAS